MRLALVRASVTRPKSWIIALFTWSGFSHAGFITKTNDQLFDASESRGNVDYGAFLKDLKNQKIVVYDVPCNDDKVWDYLLAKRKVNTGYDWKGILGWFPGLGSNDPTTVYCFELVLQALLAQEELNGYKTKDIAPDLLAKLFRKPIDSEDILILMERLQLNPIYKGKAQNYMQALR
jgi:hypothetical protein